MANPSPGPVEVTPKSSTIPPKVSIFSPEDNSVYNTNNFILSFNVTEPSGPGVLSTERSPSVSWIYYKMDWQQDNDIVSDLGTERLFKDTITVYKSSRVNYVNFSSEVWRSFYPQASNLNLTGLSEGSHNVTVVAWCTGNYVPVDGNAYPEELFYIRGSCTAKFSIDAISPSISVSSIENKTYEASEVPLTFSTSEPVSNVSYVLDGQGNVTLAENTILAGLPNGSHNVTVYAWDLAGNVGISETAYFSMDVPKPFSIVPVAVASTASVAVACVDIILYLRKSKS